MAGLEDSAQRRQSKPAIASLALEIAALRPRLKSHALHLTHNAVAADDPVQLTIVRAIENIHLWRPGTDLRAWLFTILHNQFVSDVRQTVRRSTLMRSTYAKNPAVCPPRQMERLQLRDLERALARLSTGQRSVVVLIGLEGQPYNTVATYLGIPVGTVRSRLFRGRLRLRELMDGAPLPQQVQSRPSGSIKFSSELIRRDRRFPGGHSGRSGRGDRPTPRLPMSLQRRSIPAPQCRNARGSVRPKGG